MRLWQSGQEAVHERQVLVGELEAGGTDVLVDDEQAIGRECLVDLVQQVSSASMWWSVCAAKIAP